MVKEIRFVMLCMIAEVIIRLVLTSTVPAKDRVEPLHIDSQIADDTGLSMECPVDSELNVDK